jgi:muconate cycloisomerase
VWNLDALHHAMERAIAPGVTTGSPLAKSAIDVAAHDAWGRALGVPVHQLLGGCRRDTFDLTWMVSVQQPADAERLVAEGLDAGYTMFDVKIGMHGEAGDLDLVQRARPRRRRSLRAGRCETAATRSTPRCDRRDAFADLDIALFEQPLNGFNLSGYRRLQAQSPVPIGIDESLRSVPDLLEYVRADAIGVAVAKVQRNAGPVPLAPALRCGRGGGPRALAVGADRDRPRPRRRPAARRGVRHQPAAA